MSYFCTALRKRSTVQLACFLKLKLNSILVQLLLVYREYNCWQLNSLIKISPNPLDLHCERTVAYLGFIDIELVQIDRSIQYVLYDLSGEGQSSPLCSAPSWKVQLELAYL